MHAHGKRFVVSRHSSFILFGRRLLGFETYTSLEQRFRGFESFWAAFRIIILVLSCFICYILKSKQLIVGRVKLKLQIELG